ncbi:unnamed protein product [Mycena citricolor]|uniref:Oxidoreductase n=1 Tax=Mycena citricolor TaxID=2018698 RepID=A0AAD2H5I2_9AGAR|nr:unnamed protein product [Mycena citricolor]
MQLNWYNPDTEIPDLTGKVIVVTGGTAGIGHAVICELVKHHPKQIYFTGRPRTQGEKIVAELSAETIVTFLECDHSSQASVRAAATRITDASDTIDIVFCIAGVMSVPPAVSVDGYEMHMAVNHLAHALLIKMLLPSLLRAAAPRVVITSSAAFGMHPRGGISFDTLRTPQGGLLEREWRYAQSKLANILFAAELARRYPHITALSTHPGVVQTAMLAQQNALVRLLGSLMQFGTLLTPAQGAYTQLWAGTASKDVNGAEIVNGEKYDPIGVPGAQTKVSRDAELAGRLWDWTEQAITLQQ